MNALITNSVITGILSENTFSAAINPSPILTINSGIKLNKPFIPFTITANPAAPLAAKAVNPVAATVNPAPKANVPTPRSANTPANANNTGTTGVNKAPATPSTVNTPAIVNKPIPMVSRDILPNACNALARDPKANDSTTIAVAPMTDPLIALAATVIIDNAPAIAMSPFAIVDNCIDPIDVIAFPNFVN